MNDYEYDKSIRDKNKNIQSLESEIAALNGLSDAASKAKRAKLMSDLSEAQEDLEDTLKDHYFEISSDSLDEMKDKLQEGFDETWKKISQDITAQAQLLAKAQDVATSSVNTVNRNLQELLSFFGVPSHNADDIIGTHYASGARSVPTNLHAWVNENGQELITSNKGTITPLAKGDGVIPASLTDRLIELANGNMVNALNISDFSVPNIEIDNLGSVTQHYDSLINIEGSADAATVEDLKKYGKEFLEKSYKYTSDRMSRGARKGGGKRQI